MVLYLKLEILEFAIFQKLTFHPRLLKLCKVQSYFNNDREPYNMQKYSYIVALMEVTTKMILNLMK